MRADDGGIWLYRDSEVMTVSGFNARKIEPMRQRASTYLEGTLGKGRWDHDAFGGEFERYVQDQAEAFEESIARHLLFQLVTGRTDKIDARADKLAVRWMHSLRREVKRLKPKPMRFARGWTSCARCSTRWNFVTKASRCRCSRR